jgi:hypothetical protein
MPEGFGNFDPFTGFGGPYALQAQSSGYVKQGRVDQFRRGHGAPVGGQVHQQTFGKGLNLLASIGQDVSHAAMGYGAYKSAKSRSVAFQGAHSIPDQEDQAPGPATAPMIHAPGYPQRQLTEQQPLRFDTGFAQAQRKREATYDPSMRSPYSIQTSQT